MEPDSDETYLPDSDISVVSIRESGYSSSPFLMQITLTLAYNGFKIVMLSRDKFDMETNLNCIQGPPAAPIHPESAKNITFLQKIVNHSTLLEWLFSLSNKTTSLSVLVIDKLDLYFSNFDSAAVVLAVLRHTVNTHSIKLIFSLSQQGLKYSSLVDRLLTPDKILRAAWSSTWVQLKDEREGLVLHYRVTGNRQIRLNQLLKEQVSILVDADVGTKPS